MRPSQRFEVHENRLSGSALVLVLILVVIVFIAVTASFQAVMFQLRMTERSLNFKQAFALAEAGVENAIHELNKSENKWTGWSSGDGYSLTQTKSDHSGEDIGQFTVTVYNSESANPVIEATGYVPSVNDPKVRRTIRVNVEVDQEPSFFRWGLYAFEELQFASSFYTDSYRSSRGAYPGRYIADKRGNVGGAANVNAYWGSDVDVLGSIQVGGLVEVGGSFSVTGDLIENNAGTLPPAFPDDDLAAAQADNDNDQITINGNPFAGGEVLKAKSNATIVMPPGNYFFTAIKLPSNIDILVQPPGPVKVYVEAPSSNDKAVELQSNTTINANTEIPSNFQFFVKQGDVIYQSNESSWATIFAPNSFVSLQSNLDWYGAIVGNVIEMQSNQGFHYDEDLGSPSGSAGGVVIQSWMEISPKN